MTKPMRRRDGSGKFLPRGQVPGEYQRPDNPPSDGKEKPRPDAPKRCCEECRQELEEQRVIMRRHVIYISACPRCTPEPLSVLQGD